MPVRFALLALLLLSTGTAVAQTDAAAQRREAVAELRSELAKTSLPEGDQEYLLHCIVNDRVPGAECDPQRLLMILFRLGADADRLQEMAQNVPAETPEASGGTPRRAEPSGEPVTPFPSAGPTAPRQAVAFARSGGSWAVGSGSGFMAVNGPPTLALDPSLEASTAAILQGVGTARSLAMGAGGVTVVTGASGETSVHKAEAGRFCQKAVANLESALRDVGRADADVVLHPTSCEWMLIARGQVRLSPGSASTVWTELRADVQGRLDAGERPVVAMHPNGRGYVVVTPSVVLRGDGVPESFEQMIYGAQRGAVGEVQSIAFHPSLFNGASGEATGYVIVGRAGYAARGVDRALCDAIETVTENSGTCRDALGLTARTFEAPTFDPNGPVIAVERGTLQLPSLPSTPPTPADFFDPQRPTLAVLVHGITPDPGAEDNHNVGTIHHTVRYWGWDFLSTLLYRHDSFSNAGVHLLSRRENARGEVTVQESQITANEWYDCTDAEAYATCQARTPWPYSSSQQTTPAPGLAPVIVDSPEASAFAFGAMVTYRDGSRRIGEQVAEAVHQIYDSYQAYFGHLPPEAQPQLAVMAHSFGGIVARAMFSLGDDATAAALGAGNEALYTQELRDRAAFLRDRTLHLTTLSTPHTGSPLIGMTQDLNQSILGYGRTLSGTFDVLSGARDIVGGGRVVLNDIAALEDDSGERLNASVLHPAKARRADGSMIPVYTLGGRSPGGPYMYSSKLLADAYQNRASLTDMFFGGRHAKEAMAQFVLDRLLARLGYGPARAPWGTAVEARGDLLSVPYPAPSLLLAANGRRIGARVGIGGVGLQYSTTLDTAGDVLIEELADLGTHRYGNGWQPDGAYDSDGLVGFPSSHGLGMLGDNEPLEYFGNEQAAWSVPTGIVPGNTAQGSWYRLYEEQYGTMFPWDFDNHGSLTFNPGNGAYLHTLLYSGPTAGAGPWSTWNGRDNMAPIVQESIEVEVTRLVAIGETRELETRFLGDGADWTIYIQIGDQITRRSVESGNTWTGSALARQLTRAAVVPIRISVIERDNDSPDDPVHLSAETGREALVLYLDVRNRRVYGDVNGALNGGTFSVRAPEGHDNRARINFRVSVQ